MGKEKTFVAPLGQQAHGKIRKLFSADRRRIRSGGRKNPSPVQAIPAGLPPRRAFRRALAQAAPALLCIVADRHRSGQISPAPYLAYYGIMTGILILILGLCALMLVPCVMAAADVRLDMRISFGDGAPARMPTLTDRAPAAPPHGGAYPANRASHPVALYANRSIRMESRLQRLELALQRIEAGKASPAALIARNTLRRLGAGDAPTAELTEFARKRLELIALGQDCKAAAFAAEALQ